MSFWNVYRDERNDFCSKKSNLSHSRVPEREDRPRNVEPARHHV